MSAAAKARPLHVGLVQMAMGESAEANQARAEQGIREAAGLGARLICLPELYRSRYFCQVENADSSNLRLSVNLKGIAIRSRVSD